MVMTSLTSNLDWVVLLFVLQIGGFEYSELTEGLDQKTMFIFGTVESWSVFVGKREAVHSCTEDNSLVAKTTSSYYTSVAGESEGGTCNGEDNSTPSS